MISPTKTAPVSPVTDRRRYLRVLWFFARITLSIVWWEVAVRRLLGRKVAARGRAVRLRHYARDFRRMAIVMGGVMIKLGQFISARVDVMPASIIDELADLQDEVPAEQLSDMLPLFLKELGAPPDQIFAEFDLKVRASASLGQVYKARLASGEQVIVKAQRPHIEAKVATDLAALREVARWTMWWSLIRKRADVPALLDEFAATLWQELDYEAEAAHAERLKSLLAHDMRVYVPEVFSRYSTRQIITLEDVTSIKITDHAALEAAGIDRSLAAQRLLDLYLKMIFDFGFFHADPHPGNLFIYPLPQADAESMGQETHAGRPFYVVFVDFGMVGEITPQVKEGLRKALISVATRDARGILDAYQMLGMLLPSADLKRIEEVEREILEVVWGRSIPELAQMPRSEMQQFAVRYRDLLYEMPFQIPQNFIYLVRALGMLSGICSGLDPHFNPWNAIADYAQKLIVCETRAGGASVVMQEAIKLGQVALGLPHQMQSTLERIEGGQLQTRISLDDPLRRDLQQLELAINRLTRGLIFASLLIAGTLLTIAHRDLEGLVAFGLAGLSWLTIVLRSRRS